MVVEGEEFDEELDYGVPQGGFVRGSSPGILFPGIPGKRDPEIPGFEELCFWGVSCLLIGGISQFDLRNIMMAMGVAPSYYAEFENDFGKPLDGIHLLDLSTTWHWMCNERLCSDQSRLAVGMAWMCIIDSCAYENGDLCLFIFMKRGSIAPPTYAKRVSSPKSAYVPYCTSDRFVATDKQTKTNNGGQTISENRSTSRLAVGMAWMCIIDSCAYENGDLYDFGKPLDGIHLLDLSTTWHWMCNERLCSDQSRLAVGMAWMCIIDSCAYENGDLCLFIFMKRGSIAPPTYAKRVSSPKSAYVPYCTSDRFVATDKQTKTNNGGQTISENRSTSRLAVGMAWMCIIDSCAYENGDLCLFIFMKRGSIAPPTYAKRVSSPKSAYVPYCTSDRFVATDKQTKTNNGGQTISENRSTSRLAVGMAWMCIIDSCAYENGDLYDFGKPLDGIHLLDLSTTWHWMCNERLCSDQSRLAVGMAWMCIIDSCAYENGDLCLFIFMKRGSIAPPTYAKRVSSPKSAYVPYCTSDRFVATDKQTKTNNGGQTISENRSTLLAPELASQINSIKMSKHKNWRVFENGGPQVFFGINPIDLRFEIAFTLKIVILLAGFEFPEYQYEVWSNLGAKVCSTSHRSVEAWKKYLTTE
ncbi:hypothetical protein Fcan01_24352 [Folsomia candida]|uniref:Uncharacterized protein n=1 Tax=Folsomia candida TaxID=158441 RepID=A0A226D6S1_FOLCA|nr:hypothetical protein Fcan01_24352 [Folsomia candida]